MPGSEILTEAIRAICGIASHEIETIAIERSVAAFHARAAVAASSAA
jgi:hypothetical protein